MEYLTAAALRQKFLKFFQRNGHEIVKSSPLFLPAEQTLMFVNAGMVQFKDVFMGLEKRPYTRATTCQKCMRVSGKHNDFAAVGRTARHHTFFEMLGNFSFGDYFKAEAINFAWEFITKEIGLAKERLWITVFSGEEGLPPDEEALQIWQKVTGFTRDRIIPLGIKENFWAMGDTGPCGPCTEIHYDMHFLDSRGKPQSAPTLADFENGRLVEIWNNVFMQFVRDASGKLAPLPKPSVDTGLGLERLACMVQNEDSNYHSDLFLPLISTLSTLSHKSYQRSASEDDVSFRVIADHARAATFLIGDGVQPSNEGRGYVLRRILRRSMRHGQRLGLTDPFLGKVCQVVIANMQEVYPELRAGERLILEIVTAEEKSFSSTLETGLRLLKEEMHKAAGQTLTGEVVFKLYDTYGFPLDLTESIAAESGFKIDEAGFKAALAIQQERSRSGSLFALAAPSADKAAFYQQLTAEILQTTFVGYEQVEDLATDPLWEKRTYLGREYFGLKVTVKGSFADELVLEPTPFYATSGGQVADQGIIMLAGSTLPVVDVYKPTPSISAVRVKDLTRQLTVGETVWVGYDLAFRQALRVHHSATHLLQLALQRVLGAHVKQAGSYLDAEHLRFDYTHFSPLSTAQLLQVEEELNQLIAAKTPITTEIMPLKQAEARGVTALFGEKYGEEVRVVTMGASEELCGGTHARNTEDLELMLITLEEGVAIGVRRIEAKVGKAALAYIDLLSSYISEVSRLLAGVREPDKLEQEESLTLAAELATQPILQAVLKAVKRYNELLISLVKEGATANMVSLDTTSLVQMREVARAKSLLADLPLLARARSLRTLFKALTALVNAKGPALLDIVKSYEADDCLGILNFLAEISQVNQTNGTLLGNLAKQKLLQDLPSLLAKVVEIGKVKLLFVEFTDVEAKTLRSLSDDLRDRLADKALVICLVSTLAAERVSLLLSVSQELTGELAAGKLVSELAPLIGGKGGGRPNLAEAGGNNPQGIEELQVKLQAKLAAYGLQQ